MKKILILSFLFFVSINAFSQYNDKKAQEYSNRATNAFNEGSYDTAASFIETCEELCKKAGVGFKDAELKTKIDACLRNKKLADEAFARSDYSKAKEYYGVVVKNNPKDATASSQLRLCNRKFNEEQAQEYFSKAQKAFNNSRYTEAQEFLNRSESLAAQAAIKIGDNGLKKKIEDCSNNLRFAEDAFNNSRYSSAKNYYNIVLSNNPNDSYARGRIGLCNDKIRAANATRSNTYYGSSRYSSSSLLEPRADKMIGMEAISSFDNLYTYGFGVHWSREYFHMGVDFSFSSRVLADEDFSEDIFPYDKIDQLVLNPDSKTGNLGSGEYLDPKLQFSINPGVQLSYVSLDLGIGAFLANTADLSFAEGYSINYFKVSNNSTSIYPIIKPKLTCNIPITNGFCLTLSVGYNVVIGASHINGVQFGIGLCEFDI